MRFRPVPDFGVLPVIPHAFPLDSVRQHLRLRVIDPNADTVARPAEEYAYPDIHPLLALQRELRGDGPCLRGETNPLNAGAHFGATLRQGQCLRLKEQASRMGRIGGDRNPEGSARCDQNCHLHFHILLSSAGKRATIGLLLRLKAELRACPDCLERQSQPKRACSSAFRREEQGKAAHFVFAARYLNDR